MDFEKRGLCVKSKKTFWYQNCKDYHNGVIVEKLWKEAATDVGTTYT